MLERQDRDGRDSKPMRRSGSPAAPSAAIFEKSVSHIVDEIAQNPLNERQILRSR